MNSQQAKEILLAYRPGLELDDPEVASALEVAGHDAELRRWLDEHCAVQQALCASFRQIKVPEGLKEQIISERKALLTRQVRRRKLVFAVATAAFVFLLGVAILLPRGEDNFSQFRTRMATLVLREYPRMDLVTNDLSRIQQFLAQNEAHADYALPRPLAQSTATGCAVLKWRTQTVSMICFNSGTQANPGEPSDVFLFVVDSSAVPKAPPASPRFAQLNKLATLSWSVAGKTYILAGYGDEPFIRKFL